MTPRPAWSTPPHRWLSAPGAELSRFARFVAFQAKLWRFCARRLNENNLFAMSAALSFQTIFALIPTLVLALLAAGALGVLEDSKTSLRQFLQASGFAEIVAVQELDGPAAEAPEASPPRPSDAPAPAVVGAARPDGDAAHGTRDEATSTAPGAERRVINVADEIERVVTAVQGKLTFERIGPVGALLFIWTALSLLSTMESSLNRVFGAPRNRSVWRRVLLYWSTMTLGPVLLAAAIFIGRRAVTSVEGMPALSVVVSVLGWVGPTLVGVFVLAAVYMLLPNQRVSAQTAVGGALAAVLLWLVARWGFALYVERFVVKGNLYGILGVLPLFFLWLNLSWLIFLFGAELAYTTANLKRMEQVEDDAVIVLTTADALAAAVAVARPYGAGAGPVALEQIIEATGLSNTAVRRLVERLATDGVLCSVRGEALDRYVLARPAAHIRIGDVLAIGAANGRGSAPTRDSVTPLLDRVTRRLHASVADLTLADVLADDESRPDRRANDHPGEQPL
ncbi:MAG: YhjD/YihY/BrkB family envelope integrity protein [Phycisphaerae bacterium]